MSDKHILVADDDTAIRTLLVDFLDGEGFKVSEAKTGAEVLTRVSESQPDLTIMDMRMPELNGLDVLQKLKEKGLDIPVIVMTAYGTSTIAIKAIQLGAFDYLTKPFELDEVLLTINRVLDYRSMASEVKQLRQQLDAPRDPSERIIGQSPKMIEVYKTIGRTARSNATVLITGETGTGKELVAEVIHQNSSYRSGMLVKVACSSLPETLLESELFGHEKGAFTSAIATRKGRFEMANKGSIFLDEIGEMTLSTQKKLLRVLQEREFERVGGNVPIKVDTRVIAATNRTLEDEVAAGRFREDLFYRLNVIRVHMPPLRERREDIAMLVGHFLDKHRFGATAAPAKLSEAAMRAIEDYDWPGNVRQLENIIQRAVVLAQGGVITTEHLVLDPTPERKIFDIEQLLSRKVPLKDIVGEVERAAIGEALRLAHGNRSKAASMLGIYRRLLYAKMREHGLLNEGEQPPEDEEPDTPAGSPVSA